jgi:PHD/YefM family antitoxin component YafN of YafNO toxin-antitoxin module
MAAEKRAKQQKARAKSGAKSGATSGATSRRDGAKLKSTARPKQKQKPKSGAKRERPSKTGILDGARALPLAALRAALGTEVDRVRRHGGYTLILRRGKPVAAVIPFEEFRRYRMKNDDRSADDIERDERARRGAEILADIRRVREAIARDDAAKKARGERVPVETAAELINRLREERTQQILDAAEGRT